MLEPGVPLAEDPELLERVDSSLLGRVEELRSFYLRHNPAKAKNVRKILLRYRTVEAMNDALRETYEQDLDTPPDAAASPWAGDLASEDSSEDGVVDVTVGGNVELGGGEGKHEGSQPPPPPPHRPQTGAGSQQPGAGGAGGGEAQEPVPTQQALARATSSRPSSPSAIAASPVLGTLGIGLLKPRLEAPPPHPPAVRPMTQRERRIVEKSAKDKQREHKREVQASKEKEARLREASKAWETTILPNWYAKKDTKSTRTMVYLGIPPAVRGKVWPVMIGNQLQITQELYRIFTGHARLRRASYHREAQRINEGGEAKIEDDSEQFLGKGKEGVVICRRWESTRLHTLHTLCSLHTLYHWYLHSLSSLIPRHLPMVLCFESLTLLLTLHSFRLLHSFRWAASTPHLHPPLGLVSLASLYRISRFCRMSVACLALSRFAQRGAFA